MAYADFYFCDKELGITKVLLPKCGRRRYHATGAVVVFFGTFLIFSIPLFVNQVLWLLTVPPQTILDAFSDKGIDNMFFPELYAKHPYINNFVYTCLPGVVGGLIALLSYALSQLHASKRFVVLAGPGLAYILICFFTALTNNHIFNISYYLMPMSPVTSTKPWFLIFLIIGLLALNLAALIWKIKFDKDEI